MKIYTKTGDTGKTDLNNQRIKKNDQKIIILGLIDEINVLLMKFNFDLHIDFIDEIYYNLYLISSELHLNKKMVEENVLKHLENEIDDLQSVLPNQTNFIKMNGILEAIDSFYLRAKIRNLETLIYGVLNECSCKYINRLSDYFFVLGRYINFQNNTKEEILKIRKE